MLAKESNSHHCSQHFVVQIVQVGGRRVHQRRRHFRRTAIAAGGRSRVGERAPGVVHLSGRSGRGVGLDNGVSHGTVGQWYRHCGFLFDAPKQYGLRSGVFALREVDPGQHYCFFYKK